MNNVYDYKVLADKLLERFDIIKVKLKDTEALLSQIRIAEEAPCYWSNTSMVVKNNKKKSVLEKQLQSFNSVKKLIDDFIACVELSLETEGGFEEDELKELFSLADNKLQSLWIETLLNGEYDGGPAILSFHPGAGGEEAQDWAEMLVRMYTRYAQRVGYTITTLDYLAGDGAGIKSVSLLIDGPFAYGYLKTEKGVHRLVRLSPFDANNRRHTSFASVEVSPFVDESADVKINFDDLKIDTYRSSGAGGQHVNKTESAIRITHLPTGIVVQCQNERSQLQNKEMAMKMLYSKLVEKELAEKEQEKQKRLGENKKIEWGSQIRSYVLHPYNMVKDHRTNVETSNSSAVLDGDIQQFINAYLKEFD